MQQVDARQRAVLRSFERFLLKYVPYVCALMFTGFCLYRGCGGNKHFVVSFLGYSGILWAPYIFASSYSHGFCRWHRHLIWYDGIIGMLIYIEHWHSFGPIRVWLNWIAFALGLILVGIVTHKIIHKHYCNA